MNQMGTATIRDENCQQFPWGSYCYTISLQHASISVSNGLIIPGDGGNDTAKLQRNIRAEKWQCHGFQCDNWSARFKSPVEVSLSVDDDYLCADFEPLNISVADKNFIDLSEHFCDILSYYYFEYYLAGDSELMPDALEYKRWFQNNLLL